MAPKRAQGFQKIKQFSHHAKIRRVVTGHPDQGLKLTEWIELTQRNDRHRLDVNRINWPGLVGIQSRFGLYDPRPRLIKRTRRVR